MSSLPTTKKRTTIVDNRDGNTLLHALERRTEKGTELAIASAFFSLDALNLLGSKLHQYARIRLLFGDDAAPKERLRLIDELRKRSDADLFEERQANPALQGLRDSQALIRGGRFEARCYTAKKFHAKAYVIDRDDEALPRFGILGSGNFTRQGLTQNIELNAVLSDDQTEQLKEWFEERWEEAAEDDATALLQEEIERHVLLHEPHLLYVRALLNWGDYHLGQTAPTPERLAGDLDPHQEKAFDAALKIFEREDGVMVCDGVGLGKSFVALALMEHFLREGKRTLLVAPKAILDNSWRGYVADYLRPYTGEWGLLKVAAMTDLRFRTEGEGDDVEANRKRLRDLHERADVVIVDESHNFRKTNALQYGNLYEALKPHEGRRKRLVLLTATPVNTHYADVAAQIALIAGDDGRVAGYPAAQVTKAAKSLDAQFKGRKADPNEDLFAVSDKLANEGTLTDVFRAVVIQRKRQTVKDLAKEVGKELRFPLREDPQPIAYELTPAYAEMLDQAKAKFKWFAQDAAKRSRALAAAALKNEVYDPAADKLARKRARAKSLLFEAYLPEEYRRERAKSNQAFQRELFLTKLVFANVMKQLESSPAAFQGILQSLGTGLAARLRFVFGPEADAWIAPHLGWTEMDVQRAELDDPDEEGDDAELSGEEMDDWADKAMRGRGLRKRLADFTDGLYDLAAWRDDIRSDLGHLKELHEEVRLARATSVDPKLERFVAEIEGFRALGRKVLVFTQSVRTSRYLARALADRFPGVRSERIDSTVDPEGRKRILHAFSPLYNRADALFDPDERPCELLVCTDVLSEGVNLQEAGAIVNYDIHWNPVRLIQRIGRVDRRLREGVEPHPFAIRNFVPPPELEEVLTLVGTVEDRTVKISRSLGLETSFFKSDDPAGNLREFNSLLDGEPTPMDAASVAYAGLMAQSPALVARARALPPGSLGVWRGAPEAGLFAAFTLVAKDAAGAEERRRFRGLVGRPVLAFLGTKGVETDAPRLLAMLAKTVPGEPSGDPSDLGSLGERLERLRGAARQAFRDVQLPRAFELRLDVWMECVP